MSEAAPRREERSSEGGTILCLPVESGSTSTLATTSMFQDVLMGSEVHGNIKACLEAAVMEAWLRTRERELESEDDPFDAVYLSDLAPDEIDKRSIRRIRGASTIEDASNELRIVDEWED